jgi:plasmid replication initiation protein
MSDEAIDTQKTEVLPPQDTVNTPETLGVTPRYVLQHNAISRSAHTLSATANKITLMALALIPPDLSSRTAAFTFTEFCKAIGYTKSGESFKLFLAALKECGNANINVQIVNPANGKTTWQGCHWFSFWEFREETGVATLSFSEELVSVLSELKWVYAKINLKDIGELQSKYAIRFFELAVSYMSLQGKGGNQDNAFYFERSLQELRYIFGISDDQYKETWDFTRKVIKEPIDEINRAGIGISISPSGIKQGRKNTGYRFDCQSVPKTIPAKKRGRKNAEIPQNELSEIVAADADNREDKIMQHLAELYPEEFAELYSAELAKPSFLPPTSEFRRKATEVIVLAQLRERHGIVK